MISLTSLMPAVAAHCLAYSKVVSAATVRTFRALLKTMRLNPRRESNPFFDKKRFTDPDVSYAASTCDPKKRAHTREPRLLVPLALVRVVIFHSIAIGIGGTPKAIGPRK